MRLVLIEIALQQERVCQIAEGAAVTVPEISRAAATRRAKARGADTPGVDGRR